MSETKRLLVAQNRVRGDIKAERMRDRRAKAKRLAEAARLENLLVEMGAKVEFEDPGVFFCPSCEDRGEEIRIDEHGIRWAKYCTCSAGQRLKEGNKHAAERSRQRQQRRYGYRNDNEVPL